MLQQFTVANWASFKDEMTLSLEASPDTEHEESVIDVCGTRLLKSAVIYGANASGKSNLMTAMNFLKMFVLTSSRETQVEEEIQVEPFRLSTECDGKPSHFEIIFFQDNTKFRYGFEADNLRIHSEWLFSSSSSREAELFTRTEGKIESNPERFKEGKGLEEKTRPNALFLSVVAQFNGEISAAILKWFRNLGFITATRNPALRFTIDRLKDPVFAERILEMSRVADLGIASLETKLFLYTDADVSNFPEASRKSIVGKIKNVGLKTIHKKFDSDNKAVAPVEFDLEKNESEGTKKYLAMTGPLIDALEDGKVLAVDELDARMHPLLSRAIVSLFNSPKNNKRAQLIFATHDTNLLSRVFFRRDQIWFTEKNSYGATSLYSLSEIKVRKDASFGKDYILGKYGAIPFIGDFNAISCDAKAVE
jgi:AAA15 family ATPase/GTPase